MLKEIITAIESYFKAHRFIRKHGLWKWIIIPGIFYTILFLFGMYAFWQSSNFVVSYVSGSLGIDKWVHRQDNDLLSFFFLMGEMMVRLILMFFYFSLFKYIFLIIGSPVFAYLSERTEAIIEGKEFPFSFSQLMKDIFRGIKLALRNTMWQAVFTISILILSFFPVVGWVTPVIMLFVECYYYGFSMMDYSCERHKLSPSESIEYITRHKGLAIGNGMMFFLMHLIPFAGWLLAPAYAVVAATISMYHQKSEL
ncbi:MAG: EI24 domain-containing protein [Chitinophagaceae bacterium]|nr:EI24 domain-containing protein [Chitinophagaceae bacterium]